MCDGSVAHSIPHYLKKQLNLIPLFYLSLVTSHSITHLLNLVIPEALYLNQCCVHARSVHALAVHSIDTALKICSYFIMEIYTGCATTTATEGDSRCVALTMHTTPATDAGCVDK